MHASVAHPWVQVPCHRARGLYRSTARWRPGRDHAPCTRAVRAPRPHRSRLRCSTSYVSLRHATSTLHTRIQLVGMLAVRRNDACHHSLQVNLGSNCLVKTIGVDASVVQCRCEQIPDTLLRHPTILPFIECRNDAARYLAETYIVKVSHVDVQANQVRDGCAAIGVQHELTIRPQVLVINPHDFHLFDSLPSCRYRQYRILDILGCTGAAPPKGQGVVPGPKVAGNRIRWNLSL